MSHISHLLHIGSLPWASSSSFSERRTVKASGVAASEWLANETVMARATTAIEQVAVRRVFDAIPIIVVVPENIAEKSVESVVLAWRESATLVRAQDRRKRRQKSDTPRHGKKSVVNELNELR